MNRTKIENTDTVFTLSGVNKTFANGTDAVHALRDINLTVHAGEIFGIIGLSGAGKSTLIRCLNLLEKPDSGTVLFRDTDLGALDRAELLRERRKIGMIFQNFNLMKQRTTLENIRFPLEIAGMKRDAADAKAKAMLELVGLPEKASAYPSELSGGQQQRVAIARALAGDPEVLLCDEATSALDPTTTETILSLLKSINRDLGVTIVIITHEMSVVQAICDRVAVLDDGRVVETGAVERVFLKPRSRATRELIFPKGKLLDSLRGEHYLRIVFDGLSAYDPVIANMILACGAPVSILSADSRSIDGIAYGQMIVRLPDEKRERDKIKHYLANRGVVAEPVTQEEIGEVV